MECRLKAAIYVSVRLPNLCPKCRLMTYILTVCINNYTKDNFEFGDNYVRMTIPYNWVDGQEKVTSKVTGKVTGKVAGKVTDKTPDKILRLIAANPEITITRMMTALSMSDSGIRKVLRKLQSQGLILRVGPDKGGHWEIIENH